MHQYSQLPDVEFDQDVPSPIIHTTKTNKPKINRRSCHKALQVLGVNPSSSKAMDILGIQDETQLEQAYHQIWISSAQVHCNGNRRKNLPMIDRKANIKACKLLGYDPSMEKIMKVLGFHILEDAHQAIIDANSPTIIHLSPLPPLNQQLSTKPYRVLGFDPSNVKASTTLGQVDLRPRYQRWARVIMGII